MNKRAPLVIFVYKRPDITKQTLTAINNNLLAKETDVFIFCDGSKKDSEREQVNAVRNIVSDFAEHNNFKSVTIKESLENKGLANSIISGVTEVINKYGRVIVLEDDLITSRSFLKFMNDCLDFYENDQSVWSIGGMLGAVHKKLKRLEKYDKDVYACYRAGSTGWASWLDRWEKVDWELSDYESFMKDGKRKKQLNRGGSDMVGLLRACHDGKIDSWAVRWVYQESKENMVSIFPRKTLVKHIGYGEGASNTTFENCIQQEEVCENYEYNLEHVEIDKDIMREYQWYLGRVCRTVLAYRIRLNQLLNKRRQN